MKAVFGREVLIDLLAKFIHLDRSRAKGKRKEVMLFPRLHQISAVRKLLADARIGGARSELPHPALGRIGQEQHDRVARAPGHQPAR